MSSSLDEGTQLLRLVCESDTCPDCEAPKGVYCLWFEEPTVHAARAEVFLIKLRTGLRASTRAGTILGKDLETVLRAFTMIVERDDVDVKGAVRALTGAENETGH